MGEILDVRERMICNYETGESNLPIDKAILLSKKYHYSLDWIYDTPGTQNQHNSKQNYLEQSDKFLVDIRDFISFSDNAYHFVIPDNCRKYVHELSSILFSSKTNSEKKRLRAELDGKYSKSNKGDVVWRISIPSDKLCSYLHFDSSFIPFIDKENDLEYEPTEKQVADAISFLNELFQ